MYAESLEKLFTTLETDRQKGAFFELVRSISSEFKHTGCGDYGDLYRASLPDGSSVEMFTNCVADGTCACSCENLSQDF